MNIENTKAQMRKVFSSFASCIKRKRCLHIGNIRHFENAKLLVVEGTIYPLLTRLKNDGLLSYRWEESTSGPENTMVLPRWDSLF
jgi:PadR family transcriptional regulator PadR